MREGTTRAGALLVLALFVTLAIPRAAAAAKLVALRWTAPPGCPSQESIEQEIAALLASTTIQSAPPLDATATVTKVTDAYKLHLEIVREGALRVRDVRGATCAAVADAAALIVAMAIDPEAAAAARAAPAPSAPVPTPPPTIAPAPSAPAIAPASPSSTAPASIPPVVAPSQRAPASSPASTSPSPTSSPPSSIAEERARSRSASFASVSAPRWRASIAALLDSATLPGAAAAGEISVGVVAGPLRVDLGGAIWPTRSATSEASSAGGTVDLLAGSIAGCLAPPPLARLAGERFELGLPCVGAELGRMHAVGFGVTTPGEGAYLWAAARGGVAGAWIIKPWLGLRLRLDAVVPITHPRFVLGGVGLVHEPALAARAALGFDARF